MSFSKSIQTKILLGFVVFLTPIFLFTFSNVINSDINRQLSEKNLQVHSLKEAMDNIERGSAIYLSNAARDYESYFRDLAVYYKLLNQDLALIDNKLEKLADSKNELAQLAQSHLSLLDAVQMENLNQNIDNTLVSWKNYRNELRAELGNNLQEPRLEWGAKYISDNSKIVSSAFDTLIMSFEQLSLQQTQTSEIIGKTTIATLISFTVLFGVFFYFHIIVPIRNTKTAFQRVAEGDFGHQIEIKRGDEIGQLVQSFNLMSARSNSVLAILSNLQSASNFESAVAAIQEQSADYLGCDLVVLARSNLSNNGYSFKSIAPMLEYRNLHKFNLYFSHQDEREHINNQLSDNKSILIANIDSYCRSNPYEIILKRIINGYPLKSAIIQPLEYSTRGEFLFFASYHESQFTEQHTELLNHLMPFINHKLKAIGELQKTKSAENTHLNATPSESDTLIRHLNLA